MSSSTIAKNTVFFLPGQTIFKEKDQGDTMYVILEGEVEIFKSTSAESSKSLIRLNKGDFFGEMALIDAKPRSATAICRRECKLLALNDTMFDAFMVSNPGFALKMIKNLAGRLRNANLIIEQALSGNHTKAVYEGILEYSQEKGVDTFTGWRVNVHHFSLWAARNLGIQDRQIPEILRTLLDRGFLQMSALGEGELIVPKNKSPR